MVREGDSELWSGESIGPTADEGFSIFTVFPKPPTVYFIVGV